MVKDGVEEVARSPLPLPGQIWDPIQKAWYAVFVRDGKPFDTTIEDVVDITARRVSQGLAHENK